MGAAAVVQPGGKLTARVGLEARAPGGGKKGAQESGSGEASAATSFSGSVGGEGGAGSSASQVRGKLRERGALKSALKSPAPASPANPKPPDDLYA